MWYILAVWAGLCIGFLVGAWWFSIRELDKDQTNEESTTHDDYFVG